MINALHLLWIVPLSTVAGAFCMALCAAHNRKRLERTIDRFGNFGKLFLDYEGCPRGAMGRACVPLEEEVLLLPELTDVDGGIWIPVNADALHELVDRYVHLQSLTNEKSIGQQRGNAETKE